MVFFHVCWYSQSAADTSLAFSATRSGWWINRKAFTILNTSCLSELSRIMPAITLTNSFTRELSSLTLEEKFHIYARPFIILYELGIVLKIVFPVKVRFFLSWSPKTHTLTGGSIVSQPCYRPEKLSICFSKEACSLSWVLSVSDIFYDTHVVYLWKLISLFFKNYIYYACCFRAIIFPRQINVAAVFHQHEQYQLSFSITCATNYFEQKKKCTSLQDFFSKMLAMLLIWWKPIATIVIF